MDYETLLPYNLEVHIKESKQLKESRTLIDHKNLKATYWEKKITKEKGEQNKKKLWDIKPYSQNVISAAFYLRTFTFRKGKILRFRVVDAGKNIVVKAEVLKIEMIKTDIGKKEAYKLKPVDL